jgi:ArsR family transcriptional regulator
VIYKKNDTVCGAAYINERVVEKVKRSLPANERLINNAEILKVLGYPTRLKIVMALAKTGLCVCIYLH